MKLKRWVILLLGVMLTLSSCIMIPADPVPGGTEEPTSVSETSDKTPRPPRPTVPLLSEAELASSAFSVLGSPAGGIVDISKAEYSYTEMVDDLRSLAAAHPELLSYRSIGKTVAGRDIYVAVLGNPDAERQIVVSAAIHAREYMTAQLVMKQIEFYLNHYNNGSYNGVSYYDLFEQICFYIVPMTNPDGVMISQMGEDSLPTDAMKQALLHIFNTEQHNYKNKNLYYSYWKANARGVDLNRNYDALWEQYNKADIPQSSQYKGPTPGSEPETQAMMSLINSLSNVACVLCVHSQGEVLYWNCGQSEKLAERSLRFSEAVSDRNGYKVVMEQNNDASLSDWCELKKSIVSITVEIGKIQNQGYLLPIEQFDKIWRGNYDLLPLTASWFLNESIH